MHRASICQHPDESFFNQDVCNAINEKRYVAEPTTGTASYLVLPQTERLKRQLTEPKTT